MTKLRMVICVILFLVVLPAATIIGSNKTNVYESGDDVKGVVISVQGTARNPQVMVSFTDKNGVQRTAKAITNGLVCQVGDTIEGKYTDKEPDVFYCPASEDIIFVFYAMCGVSFVIGVVLLVLLIKRWKTL